MRLWSALAGVLSVCLMWLLAGLSGQGSGRWVSALLLAFSFYGIYYSREMRPYSMVIALTLLSTYLFVLLVFRGRHRLAVP